MESAYLQIAINVGSIAFAVGLLIGVSIIDRASRLKQARNHEDDGI